MQNITTVILAAGHGKRMKSSLPKVLHNISGMSMVEHVIRVAQSVNSENIVCVVGHGKEQVKAQLKDAPVKFVEQNVQLGTGHAVMMADEYIEAGDILVLYGDVPLLSESTLNDFVAMHQKDDNDATVLSTIVDDPRGYGRIVRGSKGFERIVEHKDATPEELDINEINSGIMIVKAPILKTLLKQLENNNEQNEYYLTDIFGLILEQQGKIGVMIAEDDYEVMGINDRYNLSLADEYMQKRIKKKWMLEGVTMISPASTYIEIDVQIGKDTVIYPNSILQGNTVIGEDCIIGPSADIKNSIIDKGVSVKHSTIIDSKVDEKSSIGPYAYLRPKSDIGKHVKIGDFVEVKNSRVGDHSKVSHLSYIGDGEVGTNVNVGCGVVFVNYDGTHKHLTQIEDNAFIGCNTNLVAPVKVGKGAYVAAGSTITEDVPADAMAIARERQVIKTNWSNKYQKKV
ncbi:bifunctional UDP-N-acetylglucosamine diphosphorylase/glucosamine-1-phosphate N-acetyltransferase GlmU [Fusibacter sp. Q10-2]|uniref:Bifunctional protein GlmU n=1 Tax=Fusibacter ferrireducens TaxID=2785058 RepID=A0ABR9ZYU8_9FIRM|nr:bifunctional UDP-N-acetylglucosamine diphosphorylase/glucosamine-1-phosphate N-acetyltransferase GlmU [Fusibacter ferrireducens]MBF4695627.1 bifunctional UDP-N-acetylglucosamine diphosphorylase/glucosamine-1-phosphate N-acetyltransferase GlmU [Fusibacter ferrireducens]